MRTSLQQRVFRAVLIAAIPVFICHLAIQIATDIRSATESVALNTQDIAVAAIPLLQSTLVVGDLDTAQQTLNGIMRNGQFVSLRLFEKNGKDLLAEGTHVPHQTANAPPEWFINLIDFHFSEQHFPIQVGGTAYGILVLEPSAAFLVRDIWQRFLTASLLWSLTVGLALLLLKLLLHRVLQPLADLAKTANQFGDGNLNARAAVSDVPDLAATATAFNTMADKLVEARDKLEFRVRETIRELDSIVTRVPVGVYKMRWRKNSDPCFEYVSPRWCILFEIDADTVYRDARVALSRIHPDEVEDFLAQHEAASDAREPFHWEGRLREGLKVRWIRIESTPTPLDDGDLLWEGIQYDITPSKVAEANLEAERIHLRTVLQTIPDLIWLKDPQGIYRTCNPEFERCFGASETEIVGKSDFDFVDRELAEAFRSHDREAMSTGGLHINEEWVTYASDGHRVLLETVKTPMWDAEGKIIGVLGIAHDITERRRIEEELRKETAFRQQLIDATPGVLYLFDSDGKFLIWNRNFELVTGRSAEEIASTHPLQLFDESERSTVEQAILKVFASGKSAVEASFVTPEGKRTPHYFNGYLIDVDGHPCLLGMGVDISPRKQAEDALRSSEEKLRGLYELSPLGIALTDMKGRYVEFNAAFSAICGYSADELRILDYWTLTPRKYEVEEQRQLEALAATGRYGPYEKEYQRKDGTLVPLRLNGMLVRGTDGQQKIWSIVEDISEMKRAEAVLQETVRELNHLISRIPVGVYKLRMLAGGGMRYDYVSQRWCELLETTADAVYSDPEVPLSCIHPDDIADFLRLNAQTRNSKEPFVWEGRLRDGLHTRWLRIESAPNQLDNGDILWEGIQYDITATKEHTEKLNKIAHYDSLTRIPNRLLLADRMHQAIAQCQRLGATLAVCYLDLDGFKPVNDTLGHQAGDILLIEIAHRLISTIRGGDTVARIGGDEFVVLLVERDPIDEYQTVIKRILSTINAPIQIGSNTAIVSASIGISLYPKDDHDPDLLLRDADEAMYRAKQAGRNRYCFFSMSD